MSFRDRLILGLVVPMVLVMGAQSIVAYNLFQGALDANLTGGLNQFAQAVTAALELGDSRPRIALERLQLPAEFASGRYRLSRDGQVYLEGGGPFPEKQASWRQASVELNGGWMLEVALNRGLYSTIFSAFSWVLLASLPLSLLLALGFAVLLYRYLMSPLRSLTQATQALAQVRFPKPVRVPPGEDELARLAHSFNRMTQALQQAFERERAFTRYASHELRTPLSALKVQLEALELGLVAPQEALPTLQDAAQRIEAILAGLLSLTRRSQANPESLDLKALVKEVVAALPKEKSGRVQLELPADPVIALGARDLVKQAAANLLDNALKHTGGPVDVRLEQRGREVALSVRDCGCGVPEPLLARLAEPFFRLDHRKGGLGLGLALVQSVAESNQGKLALRNVHPGLEATLILPGGLGG